MSKRLLTVIDIDNYLADMGWPISKDGMQYAWLKQALQAQIELTHLQTLKAVGGWLENKMVAIPLASVEWKIRLDEVETFKRGEMPEEEK